MTNSAPRWGYAFILAAGLHLAGGWFALYYSPKNSLSFAQPAAAIMVDLAPVLAAPPTPVHETPPGPLQEDILPPQVEQVVKQEEEPVAELPVIEKAEAVLAPEPEPEEVEKEIEPVEVMAEQEAMAPPVLEAPPEEKAVVPVEGASSSSALLTPVTWQVALLGHLEKHKHYPREARMRREEGVVYVRLVIDRKGIVLKRWIEQGGGFAVLDQEALDMLDRSQPLPPPPPDIKGDKIELVVPVEFFIR